MDSAVIAKIQKLLARGDEARNDNEHEREIAMRHAHALLAKHGLEMADVTGAEEMRDHLGPLVKGECGLETKWIWEAGVWQAIAELNGCKIVRSGKKSVYIVGRRVRADVIKSMARFVVDSIIREARKSGYTVNGFGQGAWAGVSEQVRRILRDMERGNLDGEQLTTGTALILVNQHALAITEAKDATKEFFPNLRTSRGSRTRDHSGYSAGREYGKSIGLNQQVAHQQHKRLA